MLFASSEAVPFAKTAAGDVAVPPARLQTPSGAKAAVMKYLSTGPSRGITVTA